MMLEKLRIILKGIKNFDKVLEGVMNKKSFTNLSIENQEEILSRLATCANCPFNSINANLSKEYFNLFGEHYETKRSEPHCALCGCIIEFKTACLSCNCGIEEYNRKNPLNKQELKWKSKS